MPSNEQPVPVYRVEQKLHDVGVLLLGTGCDAESTGGVRVFTFTTTDRVVLDVAFVAVSTYVVVCAGVTARLVPVTAPTPLMLSDVAFATVQLSVVEAPAFIVAGVAINEEIVGAGVVATFTVIVVFAVTLPRVFVAVNVYVVVRAGRTDTVVPVTVPTPLSIVSERALRTLQVNVAALPLLIVAG
jgi:hypothetical protein